MKIFKFKKRGLIIGSVLLFLAVLSLCLFLSFKNDKQVSASTSNIPIAMALDDGYLYPTIVAMTSIMENSNKNTECDFYIMHPADFKEENKEKLKTLSKKYSRCHVNLIDMGNQYKNANDKGHITTPAYYRLSLSELLPQLDKIIWLDGDTLTLQDLRQMYDIDMKGYYYKGWLDDNVNGTQSFNIYDDHYICSGVMLINLKALRENKMVEKFEQFIKENNNKLVQHDQTVINVLCCDKIGILPPKFGMFNYHKSGEAYKSYSDNLISPNKYTPQDLIDAFNDLCVLHCVCKPWKSKDVAGSELWWNYARKTDFFEEIHSKYPIF